jgi:uncharacterized protein involved in exopolysaccharide biosynthesis
VSLVWCVPVVAAAVAAGLVLARARPLDEASLELRREVAQLGRLRRPLARLRAASDDTEAIVEAFRARHASAGGPGAESDGPT